MVQYVNEVRNLTGKMRTKIIMIHANDMIARIFRFTRERGIVIKPCPAYVHEPNGTAERFKRSVVDIGKSLLLEANSRLGNAIKRKTSYEIFFNRQPLVIPLKIY